NLAPSHDPLLEGLEDLRLNATLAQFRELFGLQHMGESADKYAAVFMELPKRLDQALTLAAEGRARDRIGEAAATVPRRQRNSTAAVIALLLLLVTIAVLSHHFASTGAGAWIGKADAILFVTIGALLLRAASRME